MKTTDVHIQCDPNEFNEDQKKELKSTFFELVKYQDRIPGTILIFKEVVFLVGHSIFNLDTGERIYNLQQQTTKSKLVKPS